MLDNTRNNQVHFRSLCSKDAPGLYMEQSIRQEVSHEQRLWIIFTVENPVKCTKLLEEELTVEEQ